MPEFEKNQLIPILVDSSVATCQENIITAFFGFILKSVPTILKWFLGSAGHVKPEDLTISTQTSISSKKRSQLDLLIEGKNLYIIVEIKWNSPLTKKQVEKYFDIIAKKPPNYKKALIVVTKNHETKLREILVSKYPNIVPMAWYEIAEQLKHFMDEVPKEIYPIVVEFCKFLYDNAEVVNPLQEEHFNAFWDSEQLETVIRPYIKRVAAMVVGGLQEEGDPEWKLEGPKKQKEYFSTFLVSGEQKNYQICFWWQSAPKKAGICLQVINDMIKRRKTNKKREELMKNVSQDWEVWNEDGWYYPTMNFDFSQLVDEDLGTRAIEIIQKVIEMEKILHSI